MPLNRIIFKILSQLHIMYNFQIACGEYFCAVTTREGELYTWGVNYDGQLGNGNRREQVLNIYISDKYMVCLFGRRLW